MVARGNHSANLALGRLRQGVKINVTRFKGVRNNRHVMSRAALFQAPATEYK